MTIFAGIVARGTEPGAIPAQAIDSLRRSLSRQPGSATLLWNGATHAFVSLDCGVFDGGAARTDESGVISLFGGDPLIDCGSLEPSRARALDELHRDWSAGNSHSLLRARGSFCGVHYDPGRRRLWLVTDKLGLRPIYYALLDDFVIFATSMRVLESNPLVPQRGDLQGLAETACFGYPLGPRSMLDSVCALEAGQIVEVTPRASRSIEYWRWDEVPPCNATEDEICAEIQRVFTSAVRLRLGAQQRAVSLLSAGLDSRCIAACLRSQGAEVHTIGFGPEGSADQVIARQVSAALGTTHFDMPHGVADFWPRQAGAHATWMASPGKEWPVAIARALWTGEGGDRVLAPVNLNEDVIAAMRAGDPDGAIAAYMLAEHTGLPRRLFRRRVREAIRRLPSIGLRAELDRHRNQDVARRFHLYVLVNEARRNIKQHFEDLDLSRVELIMPFYDAELVRIVLRHPIDLFVRHRLYHRWLAYLPATLSAVPWQAYPGSEPCPLPLPPDARTQWDSWYSEQEDKEIWRAQLALADDIVHSKEFPHWLLRRPVLHVARQLLRLGFRRFGYLFEVARPFVLHPPAACAGLPADKTASRTRTRAA